MEEVEANAVVGAKRIISKMEARIRDLELELEEEKRRHAETIKILRKKERTVKEIVIQCEEDQKNVLILQESLDKANQKISIYKRQLNEQVRIVTEELLVTYLVTGSNASLVSSLSLSRSPPPCRRRPVPVASSASWRPPRTVPMWPRPT